MGPIILKSKFIYICKKKLDTYRMWYLRWRWVMVQGRSGGGYEEIEGGEKERRWQLATVLVTCDVGDLQRESEI